MVFLVLGMRSCSTKKKVTCPRSRRKSVAKWRNECKSPLFQANLAAELFCGAVCIGCVMSRALNLCFIGCLVLTVCKSSNLILFFLSVQRNQNGH